jgi:hypothetical protein
MFRQYPRTAMNSLARFTLQKLQRTTIVFASSFLFALMIFSSGCAHTEAYVEPAAGPVIPAELEVEAPLWLLSIDGKKFSNSGWNNLKRVRILPGPHVVELSFSTWETLQFTRMGETRLTRRRISGMPVKLQLLARPKKVYVAGYRNQISPTEISGVWQPFISEFEPFDPKQP